MEFAKIKDYTFAKIKDYTIDLDQLQYYKPGENNGHSTFFITFYFKKGNYINIAFKDEIERNFYLKILDENITSWDVNDEYCKAFDVDISEV